MGELCIIVNYTTKQYIHPIKKFGEIVLNRHVMEAFFDMLQNEWNECKIGILYSLQEQYETVLKTFKEVKIDWDDYNR